MPSSNNLLQLKPNTTYCGICGAHYQNRDIELRKRWSREHALTHSITEHRLYKLSGLQLLPEAAQKLQHVAIPYVDLVTSDEVSQALKEAHPHAP